MRKLLVLTLLIFLCACSSQPIPQWKDTASRQLENYKVNFLADKEDASEPHFVQAKKAISSNNDLNLLATAYLTKYALHTAALEDFDDRDFLRIDQLQPQTNNRAYYDLLKGNFGQIDPGRLPANYSKLLPLLADKNLSAATREITAISDPLSRLIACGVWVKYLSPDESILQLAIDTAARQGWRRPLWAYLTRLQQYYSDRQETGKASAIKERLELLKK
ncbi:MAG: hypothetical protein CVU54_17720 [Deltaproteobacteria bacterium HGW-Deltaproteobacteria-12]|jgi:hypothetical protein|nr:MAG: hypothetical protein CVU54_17720 [Deltaproteobacteria bacterium HGW-Deltaproteobacteria-12]